MAIASPLLLDLNAIQQEVDEEESLRKIKEKIVSSGQAERGLSVEKRVLLFEGKILLPRNSALKNRFLEEYQSSPLGGQSGVEKTHNHLAANLYWTGMNGNVTKYVAACAFGQQNEPKNTRPVGYSNLYRTRPSMGRYKQGFY